MSNSSSNGVTRAQNVLLIMSLSYSLKSSCAVNTLRPDWFSRLKRDPGHEAVMKTLRRFMNEEEDLDYEEAADAATDRRKF